MFAPVGVTLVLEKALKSTKQSEFAYVPVPGDAKPQLVLVTFATPPRLAEYALALGTEVRLKVKPVLGSTMVKLTEVTPTEVTHPCAAAVAAAAGAIVAATWLLGRSAITTSEELGVLDAPALQS